jgi:hypothetical protein
MWQVASLEKARRRFGAAVARRLTRDSPLEERLDVVWKRLSRENRERVLTFAEMLAKNRGKPGKSVTVVF